ncbi:hypothetical protein [Actinomadura rudentiformis]|uniref:Minor tail protein n=1 Tax=Actinomadura rudentiformis TaxID=359158 RepID=A0A6H9YPX4_9ACTN|nr:hypothetical protein [Actinomadura rudentiformis]KAB2344891.1 hypothetical protein F8566_30340 [Actinomadura rudentiformis]
MADDIAYPMPGQISMTTLAEWEAYFTAAEASGVAWGLDPALNVSARTATMTAGGALLRGIYKPLQAGASVSIPPPATQNRIDRLVLRLNRDASDPADFVKPMIVVGTPGPTPPVPAIQATLGTHGMWDLPIARWTSQSNGSMAGLLDERFWLGNAPILYSSYAKPTPTRRTLGLELDTGRVTRWDGSTWVSLIEDTGDLPLSLKPKQGANDYGWSSAGANVGRLVSGVVSLVINAKFHPHTTQINLPDGVLVATVPAPFRTRRSYQHFAAMTNTRIHARVEVTTSGEVWMQYTSPNDLGDNTILRLTMTYIP